MFKFSPAVSLSASLIALALSTAAVDARAQASLGSGQFTVTSDDQTATHAYGQAYGFGVASDGAYSQIMIGAVGPSSSLDSLRIAFYQTVADANTTNGNFSLNLTTAGQTGYNVTDFAPIFTQGDVPAEYSWDFSIQDLTTGNYLYQNINGVITGAAIGNLAASGSYLLTADASMTTLTDPTLTYNPTINFGAPVSIAATPEPTSLLLLSTGVIGVATAFKRRMFA